MSGEKFRREVRLRDPKTFRDLISKGEKFSSPFFFIRHRSNDIESPRLGIVAPKKTFPRVVDRNRLKRLTRESFRRAAAHLPPRDFLVYYLSPAREAEGVLLARSLRETWVRLAK